MDVGIIKLHSRLRKKDYYKKSHYVHLWVHLLFLANHDPIDLEWDDMILRVPEGQIVAGRKILSEDTGIPETTIEDILTFFEQEGQIRQQKETKYRLITIVKWKDYQTPDIKSSVVGEGNVVQTLFGAEQVVPTTEPKKRQHTIGSHFDLNDQKRARDRIKSLNTIGEIQEYRVNNIDSNSNTLKSVNDIYIYNIHFKVFWELYPRKVKKKEAEVVWARLPFLSQLAVIEDLPERCKGEKWTKDDGQFVEYPTTYLNGERWNDEIKTIKVGEIMNRTIDLTKK